MKALSKKELRAMLASVVKRLVDNLDVEKIVLFGSFVQGTPTKDSDIDLLVTLNTRKKGIARYAMVSELLEPRKIRMDIIVSILSLEMLGDNRFTVNGKHRIFES